MEHLQREGNSQFRGGPFGGRAMVQGDTGARSANITSIITSTSNNRLRVTDAPGVYAAFPRGGYAQEKGATGTRSNAIGARALYSPLSPPASPYT